jgi:hypothetical protein
VTDFWPSQPMAIFGRRYLCVRRVAIFLRGRPKKLSRKRA